MSNTLLIFERGQNVRDGSQEPNEMEFYMIPTNSLTAEQIELLDQAHNNWLGVDSPEGPGNKIIDLLTLGIKSKTKGEKDVPEGKWRRHKCGDRPLTSADVDAVYWFGIIS